MPSMANIVVKKYDGTTDVTYNALTASAGDNVAAQWRSESAGSQNNAKPVLALTSKFNGNRSARRVEVQYRYPQMATDSTTGLATVVNLIPMTLSAAIPLGVPDTVVQEAVAQGLNLMGSDLVRLSIISGFAPT